MEYITKEEFLQAADRLRVREVLDGLMLDEMEAEGYKFYLSENGAPQIASPQVVAEHENV